MRCLLVVLLYAGFVAAAILACAAVADAHLTEALARGSEVAIAHEDEIYNGDYDALAGAGMGGSEAIVFGAGDEVLFTTSTSFSRAVSVDDLEFINDYSMDNHFFVMEEGTGDEPRYRVMWVGPNDETGFDRIASYAVLDHDLNIVEGTLFEGRRALTPEQFGLLNGVIELPDPVDGDAAGRQGSHPFSLILGSGQYVLYRTQGTSDTGEQRILVVADPVVDRGDYSRAADESHGIWLLLIPVVGAATVALLAVERRLIRAATLPLANAFAQYAEHGSVEVASVQVASELRPAYDGFVDLARRLERAQADKQRMIADISHDIKTPLTVIRGYAQAFRDGMVPPGRADAYAQALCDKAEVVSRMAETLGAYAATEHPDYRCERILCDLGEKLRAICAGLEPVAAQYGCELAYELPHGAVPVELDAELLRRAVTNLVSNACVHNGAGTKVAVRCAVEGGPGGAGLARVLVLDDGAGIVPELASSVFDPFVTSNVARQVGKGTGLGLAIARRCVELNGGSIELVRAPGTWSTCFAITLPLAQAPGQGC